MSTIKAIGGTLSQFGKKLALGITSSEANVLGPQVEVNVPPIWEEANNTTGNVGNFNSSPFEGDFLVYRPYRIGTNGTYLINEADIGDTFRLSERTFISASDRNTGAELTLTLISQSIVSGAVGNYNTQEITLDDINVIFPDNATPGNTASFYIETSSNFEVHEDISYEFEIQVKDQHGYISRVNKSSDSNHNSQHNLFNRIEITNTKESPFIITQSNSVSISSSTTPSDNIGEIEFSLGNESSPDFTLIPTIYIKDKDRTDLNTSVTDIYNIKTNGDGGSSQILYDNAFPSYITATSTGGDNLIFSSSHLVANNETASARYFQLDLDPDQLPSKLSAKNSPYILEISASDGVTTKTSSSITLNITNEDPVWSSVTTSATASTENRPSFFADAYRPLIISTYASASDPGGDNITLFENISIQVQEGNKGFLPSYFEINKINENTPTASFHIIPSDNFPTTFDVGEITGNDLVIGTMRASDECSPAGTAEVNAVLYLDAPPSWSAESFTVAGNENSIGNTLSSTTYKTVFDDTNLIGTVNAGDVTLDTGSGFQITCNDSRLLDSHFIFTGTNATNGGNATFSIETSSLYDRIDANAATQIIVTASDNRGQTAFHTFQFNISNIDDLVDVLGSDLFEDLRTFYSVKIDGVTTELGNTLSINSPISSSNTGLLMVSGNLSPTVDIFQPSNILTSSLSSANGTSGLNFSVLNTQTITTRIPGWGRNTLNFSSSGGSLVMWLKTGARSSAGTEIDTIFGQPNFNFSSEGISGAGAALNMGSLQPITIGKYFTAGTSLSGRDFHQIAITWEGTSIGDTFNLYYNQTYIGSQTVSNSSVPNAVKGGSYLGALGRAGIDTPTQIQPMTLSIFASFDKELSSAEISTIFNAFSGSHGL